MGLANGQYKRFLIIHSLNIHGMEVFRQMAKDIITYIIKARTDFDDLYISNKPIDKKSTIKYSNYIGDAREFDGTEKSSIDMTRHKAIKKVYPASYFVDTEEENG